MKHLAEIQIRRDFLRSNLDALKGLSPGKQFAAVVKGNAYGHGMGEVVDILDEHVDCFQVDDLDELHRLRQRTSTRTLVLGYIPTDGVEEAVRLGCELALYDFKRLDALVQAAKKLQTPARVHLKIDALLGRQGVLPKDLDATIEALKERPEIELVAAYAHFANIEDTTDLVHAQEQLDVFFGCCDRLKKAGWSQLQRHISATSGLMTVETNESTLVRLGIGMYGLYPSAALQRSHRELGLRPVMRWVTQLAQVKVLPPRHPVGYGLTFVTRSETRIGIVPQGYSDGYDRGLSSSGEVLVRGHRCAVLGRVAMNMFAIDLTQVPEAQPEDEVVLLGDQGTESITAEEIASRLGTINYEIPTRISALLPRVVM